MNKCTLKLGGHAPLETATSPLSPEHQLNSSDGGRGARSVRSSLMGFTLVEVLVSLGIFAVLTGVVLSNYRGYNTNALFANASEDIVLALRQAQVYGVGVKGAGGSFVTPYGVHFDQTTPNKIIIFADTHPSANPPITTTSGNGRYTTSDTIIETINWGSVVSSMSLICDGGACGSGTASVTFIRPKPDAIIKDGAGTDIANMSVEIGNGTKASTIRITNTGQISLQ